MAGAKEEKVLLDWILGGLQKDQLLETDSVLKKVNDKFIGSGTGFSGLFAKN